MAITTIDRSRDQVMAYLCGLVCVYGEKPTFEEAEQYSRHSVSVISPKLAIEILGVENWDKVLDIYDCYISGKPFRLGENPYYKNNRGSKIRYTRDELIGILKGLYVEMDGKVSEQKIYARSRTVPTPSYATFVKYLGSPKTWPQIIAEESHPDEHAH